MAYTYELSDLKPATFDVNLDPIPSGLIIGGAGAVVMWCNGHLRTIPSGLFNVGEYYPIRYTMLVTTGTSATNIHMVYDGASPA
jgi:hypothetical protein